MNWDSIKYIFQIPLSWYQKIHKRVFNAYGTNFLTVREGYYGGTEVGIDSDGFAAEVNRVVDLSGYVKSVDDQTPDENGNVELTGYVKSVDDQTPDENGNVELSGVVKTIDGEEPDENGNIELSDYYVTLDTDQTITGEKTFTQSVNLSSYGILSAGAQSLNLTHGANGIALSETGNNIQQLLTNEPDRLYSTGADNQIASRGYVRLNFSKNTHTHGNISNSGQITADSGATPTNYYIAADSNGNLFRKDASGLAPSLSDYVTKDELTDYVQQDELTNYVTQSEITDFVTQNDLTDFVTQSELTDYVQQSELTDYVQQSELTNYVTQNDLTDFVTQSELTNYATQDDIDDVLDSVEEELTAYAKTSDFASGFPAATQNGKSYTNLKVVTDVTWNGTTLQYKYRNLSFSKGLLTSYGTELTTTIDTPTVITWA